MKKTAPCCKHVKCVLLFVTVVCLCVCNLRAQEGQPNSLKILAKTDHGLLAELDGAKRVLMISGTPEQMGRAHGALLADMMDGMREKLLVVAAGYTLTKGNWFFDHIRDAEDRTRPYVPDRFVREMDALADGAGRPTKEIHEIQSFPEMFHCSGVAVAGRATCDGRVRHVRVLDYMRKIGLHSQAVFMVFMPDGYNAWCSVSYSGLIGSVTAMNEKGLTIGEMGGRGEGKWDGLPMIFLIRRIMEECETVDEAIALMKSGPLTCDYYYILSDKSGNMAAIEAIAGSDEPVRVLRPGQAHPQLPGALDDTVYISGPGVRMNTLYERLKENYGKIDTPLLMEMIKRPVAMSSNLHDALFEPESLDVWFADANDSNVACDEPYFHVNLRELMTFYDENLDTK
ncbi:MAG: C45 family peptidase [Planctomycetia bacterium]|nr:C45 family peptidase [Planctomycetia bacterium]